MKTIGDCEERSSPDQRKVCHVISGYYRNDPRVFQRQCKSLRDAGYQVTILTNDGLPDEVLDGILIKSCRRKIVSRIRILLFATWQFSSECRKIDADIYQLHSPELLPLGIWLKFCRKSVVYDAHEDLPNHILEKEWIPRVLRVPISGIVKFIIHYAVSKYDATVTPHHHVAESLEEVKKPTVVISNFAKLLPLDSTLTLGIKERAPIICYSGTAYTHSNQLETLSAIESIHDVQYHIAGYIPPQLDQQLSVHPASGKLKFLGRLPWEKLREFYDSAVAGLVVIGYTKNLGGRRGTFAVNKIFEYMEAGIPIICTNYELWKDIVDEFHCGICVEPGNVDQLRSAIAFLLENREVAQEMGNNGRRAVEAKFNWVEEERKYLNLFKEIYEKSSLH